MRGGATGLDAANHACFSQSIDTREENNSRVETWGYHNVREPANFDNGKNASDSQYRISLRRSNACRIVPKGKVTLPKDDRFHQKGFEWWYWTGHLQTEEHRWFGFELAFFFLEPIFGLRGQMVHHSITDIEGSIFQYDEGFKIGSPRRIANGFELAVGEHSAVGGDGSDVLHGALPDYRMDITLTAVKAPVLQNGGDGYDEYAEGYDYYYSRERMEAVGTLVKKNKRLSVVGLAWFDHQWGDVAGPMNDWNWFGIQLDDGTGIMLYLIHDKTKNITVVGGSISDAFCRTHELEDYEIYIWPLGQWTSPHTDRVYPLGWDILVQGMNLTVTPVMTDREIDSILFDYWEGAAVVSGDVSGRASVDLTGF